MLKFLIFLLCGVCIGALALLVSFHTGDRTAVYMLLGMGAFILMFAALALDIV